MWVALWFSLLSIVSLTDDGECEDCHPSCESCSGEERNQCTKCPKGQSDFWTGCLSSDRPSDLQHHFDISSVKPQHIQLPQQSPCLLSLPPPGRFLTTQQTCVSKCPGGFFAGRLSGVCEACPPGCLQCVDAQRCSRCLSTRKTQLYLQDGQCVQECEGSGVNLLQL